MTEHRQWGFVLLELIVAVLLAALLAGWGAQALVNRMNDAGAQAHAAWMLSLKKAVQGYIERYAGALADAGHGAALNGAGYGDWALPTIAELKADGLLSPGFPEHVRPGGSATVRLMRHGSCPGNNCRIEALIHADTPFLKKRSGHIDEQMVAQWLMASQGWGGWVDGKRPGVVGGAAFEYANPPWPGSPLPAGTVALALTAGQLHKLDFLRVGDERDPNFQADATVQGTIQTGTDMRVQRYLYLNTLEQAQQPCVDDGAISREANGGVLICLNQYWLPLARRSAGGFSTHQWLGCENSFGSSTANPVTGNCSCPEHSTMVQISDSGPRVYPDGRTVGFLCVD
ncbi:putative prepilin protein [Pusillimonas sp. T7-7]|uniref:hypothetical protein n=1 Tax=Pusillimonas sp. (strain T7-7) TaxID=1007105 RepID=UPI0002084B28|nr:hypothetical protein [Pusillimonas sp. T7-7]AEC19956.1 putative prepilin protein [Pusillimonas sp. T7-7]